MPEMSEEGEEALAVYLAELRDDWIARYGRESMELRAQWLIPLWIDQALSVFSESDLIRMATSEEESPEDWPANAPPPED